MALLDAVGGKQPERRVAAILEQRIIDLGRQQILAGQNALADAQRLSIGRHDHMIVFYRASSR